jgi:DNA-binding response OmpR family regulator
MSMKSFNAAGARRGTRVAKHHGMGLFATDVRSLPLARVLVVDDEENQVRELMVGLRHEGFETIGTHEPDSVMDLLATDTVDLALLDLMMSGINGIELARKIRDAHPAIRVVLTSAYHLSERQLNRADCGVVGFVPKPYVLSELAEFIRTKIAHARPTPAPPAADESVSRLCAS